MRHDEALQHFLHLLPFVILHQVMSTNLMGLFDGVEGSSLKQVSTPQQGYEVGRKLHTGKSLCTVDSHPIIIHVPYRYLYE